jgi:polyhydroxyalkanoate synthase
MTSTSEPAEPSGAKTASEAAAAEFARNVEAVNALARDALARWQSEHTEVPGGLDLPRAFAELAARSLGDVTSAEQSELAHWARFLGVWRNVAERALDPAVEPLARPEPGDRRFRDPAWEQNPAFDLVKQQYLLASRWVEEELQKLTGIDAAAAQQVAFYTRQFVQALAPTNFLMTNPTALQATLERASAARSERYA